VGVGADAQFVFAWEETDGPEVRPPQRKGFGTRLIEAGVSTDLGAGAAIDYRPEGVRWMMRARLDALKE
jgi:two-component sensor histidine kinase